MFVGRKHSGTKEQKNLLRQVKFNCFWQPEQKNILWSIRRHAINDLILLTLPRISEQLLAGKEGSSVTGPLKKMLQQWLLSPLTAKPTIPTETLRAYLQHTAHPLETIFLGSVGSLFCNHHDALIIKYRHRKLNKSHVFMQHLLNVFMQHLLNMNGVDIHKTNTQIRKQYFHHL